MMTDLKERQMGRFSVKIELTNDADLIRAQYGTITPDQVRRVHIQGLVNSGAMRSVIPESTAKLLGLQTSKNLKVRYADGRSGIRPVAERMRLKCAGRQGVFNAIVEPGRESALIGTIVLESLDFLIDCVNMRLVPRDPN